VEKIKVPVLLQAGEDDSMEGFSTPKETKAVAEKIKVRADRLPRTTLSPHCNLATAICARTIHSNLKLNSAMVTFM
jgi:hypothetical protein